MKRLLLNLCILALLPACAATATSPFQPTLQIATPALDVTDNDMLCLEAMEPNLPAQRRVELLETLLARDVICNGLDGLAVELYSAYVRLGQFYEQEGQFDDARSAYSEALRYPTQDTEAADSLQRLRLAEPIATGLPPTCDDEVVGAALNAVADYTPSEQLAAISQSIRGVIYQPRAFPGSDWIRRVDASMVQEELTLIADSGLNTLRIYLDYSEIFQCPGNGVVPMPDAIQSLDLILSEAASRNLSVIFVLNHNPDLSQFPLYSQPAHSQAQTQWLVQRYATEPTVILWDLREGGDADYEAFGQQAVLQWLANTARLVRSATSQQITATWGPAASDTAPLVDVIGFQQASGVDVIRQDIANLQAATNRPILLGWVGYPTNEGDEIAQRNQLFEALQAAENNNLYGWVVYRAFDHPLTGCEGLTCDRYGLWNVAGFPKLALDGVTTVVATE